MLDSTNSSLDLLSSLGASFRAVETQTAAFRAQCEDLLAEQTRLSKLADGIAENARYYAYLEPITRRLNAPGAGTLVRSKEFSEMLSSLDHCLEYMQAHVSYSSLLIIVSHTNVRHPLIDPAIVCYSHERLL